MAALRVIEAIDRPKLERRQATTGSLKAT